MRYAGSVVLTICPRCLHRRDEKTGSLSESPLAHSILDTKDWAEERSEDERLEDLIISSPFFKISKDFYSRAVV